MKTHLTNIFQKLGVRDRVGLVMYALRHGLTAAAVVVDWFLRRRPSGNARGGGVARGSYGAGARRSARRGRPALMDRSARRSSAWPSPGDRRGADDLRLALLTEIGPAGDPSAARPSPPSS